MKREDASPALTEVIDAYTLSASFAYTDLPEDTSLMVLTLMDLWVALDMCSLYHCPMLRDYNPGFPPLLFEPLLLPKKSQMGRLLHVEQYLAERRKEAISGWPSVFESVGTKNSFAVRFFQQSSHHQELRQKIEAEARNERSLKISELARKCQMYQEFIKKSDVLVCEFVKHRLYSVHSEFCQKCLLKVKAQRFRVDVHEWPLPSDDLEAKAVVFELDLPTIVSNWRNTTYSLLVDRLSLKADARSSHGGKGKKQGLYILHKYDGLQRFVRSEAARLQLASDAKPFMVSHYRDFEISQASESNVCVHNGLRYSMYDSKISRWTNELLGHCDLREKCRFNLSSGPYLGLQYAVNSTIHTSNEVIASQAKCSEALTLHEFYAFGTLRSGHRLQWRNIARELSACILDFNCYETNALVTQAAWQVGASSEGTLSRESHEDLEEEEFGTSLLSALDDAFGTIEGNWQGAAAARTFVALAVRLLSLTTYDNVREGCFRLLRRARAISLSWTRELGRKLQEGQNEDELKALNTRALEMALTCHGTFDVDPQHVPRLLKSKEDVAVLTECSIVVHDRCPAVIDDLPASIKMLLRRHGRLSSLLEAPLRKRILEFRGGLDSTIRRLWAGYVPGSPWTALRSPDERWLVTETSSEEVASPSVVHYNLLDSSLLVNGSPLTRLPRSYETHPTFRRLFGEVM
jgi:hypothetical protein